MFFSFEDEMFTFVSIMKLVHQFRKFFLASLSFCLFLIIFFLVLLFFFFFFIPKETKSACFSTTTTHQQTQRKNNNKRKSIDQIIIKIKMQGARQSDVFFGERESGQDVRQSNVTAVQAVANIVKSSLGPVGLDKVL